MRHPRLTPETESSNSTAVGGIALAARLVATLGLARLIDSNLSLLQSHRPYHESDHILTHAYNLFCGGTVIEDIADLQHDEAVLRILGTDRIPDPTTAGDFLRRLEEKDIVALDVAIDEAQKCAWKKCYGKRKQKVALVDLDSHVKHVYGSKKAGSDFTYKGGLGYHPLVITLAGTQEILRLVNRPGNRPSAEDAAKHLLAVAPMLKERFKRVIVRGDSAFANQSLFEACEASGFFFAVVAGQQSNYRKIAEAVEDADWRPFRASGGTKAAPGKSSKKRRRRRDVRRRKAKERGKRDLKLCRQWVAEVAYQPARSKKTYRLVIRRQKIEETNQGELFELWRYRYVLSNLPKSKSATEVTQLTYQRCDQEKIIEQLQNGVAGMRMPTGTLLANHAFLLCARIAHNLKSWLSMLTLPGECIRWEWKRFRKAFVYIAARVIRSGRRTIIRFSDAHRFANVLEQAIVRLQT